MKSMITGVQRETAGQPIGGRFASHDRDEAPGGLLSTERPMPAVHDAVELRGATVVVKYVDGRTAVVERENGDLEIVNDADLGLDVPAGALEPEAAAKLVETLRRRRGHAFYPNMKKWPGLYATEGLGVADKTVVAHYFGSFGDWYVTEADPRTGEAFGYARLAGMEDMAEWGYFSLPELETLTAGPFVGVERELDHDPKSKVSDVIAEYRGARP